jgi:hypothetical protein
MLFVLMLENLLLTLLDGDASELSRVPNCTGTCVGLWGGDGEPSANSASREASVDTD